MKFNISPHTLKPIIFVLLMLILSIICSTQYRSIQKNQIQIKKLDAQLIYMQHMAGETRLLREKLPVQKVDVATVIRNEVLVFGDRINVQVMDGEALLTFHAASPQEFGIFLNHLRKISHINYSDADLSVVNEKVSGKMSLKFPAKF